MQDAFICDAVRARIGRYGGALSAVRADDLSAIPLAGLVRRNPDMAGSIVDDVIYGCANQAGEDNCNVARMAVLLGGMPVSVPGTTVNRMCRSGMAAEDMAARAIRSGDWKVMLAMPREPVLPDDAPHVNRQWRCHRDGSSAGHERQRLVTGAICRLEGQGGRYGLCTICGGDGAGHCSDHPAGSTPSAEMVAPSVKRCIWLRGGQTRDLLPAMISRVTMSA